jgi:hypothetical protein
MPQKIMMDFSTQLTYVNALRKSTIQTNLAPIPANKAPTHLKSGMIGRIHNIRPGCGSCGR